MIEIEGTQMMEEDTARRDSVYLGNFGYTETTSRESIFWAKLLRIEQYLAQGHKPPCARRSGAFEVRSASRSAVRRHRCKEITLTEPYNTRRIFQKGGARGVLIAGIITNDALPTDFERYGHTGSRRLIHKHQEKEEDSSTTEKGGSAGTQK